MLKVIKRGKCGRRIENPKISKKPLKYASRRGGPCEG
jgi:hypothetical protein